MAHVKTKMVCLMCETSLDEKCALIGRQDKSCDMVSQNILFHVKSIEMHCDFFMPL